MRARSIKPGICDNELLGTADLLYTVLFERLWMMADREGRLEDRPLRIKAQAFPYREGLDVGPALQWLHDNGFIRRYAVAGIRYIQVIKFKEHQKPHQNEKQSVIPTTPVEPEAEASTTKVASEHNQGSKHLALNPSSLTPDSPFSDSGLLTAGNSTSPPPPGREAKLVPRETSGLIPAGSNLTRSAEDIWNGLLEDWRRDVPEVNQDVCAKWFIYLESKGKRLGAEQRLMQARTLAGNGDGEAQTLVVNHCIENDYKRLIPVADIRRNQRAPPPNGAGKKRWTPEDDDAKH